MNAIYLNFVMSTFHSEIVVAYPSGFVCIIYCLAREYGEWVIKTPQPHSWMKLAALQANSRVRMRPVKFWQEQIKTIEELRGKTA